MRRQVGHTLAELLVTMVLITLIASISMPFLSTALTRNKEMQLKRVLIETRRAIDRFHDDWRAGLLSKFDSSISTYGYPVTLDVLVSGVDGKDNKRIYRYLRKVPENPLVNDYAEHWLLVGYDQDQDSVLWSGTDVYDIKSAVSGEAMNGTDYEDW